MPASEEQSGWVKRVLGFDPQDPVAGLDAGSDRVDRLAIWRDAKETVDGKLSVLAKELESYGDPDFDRIAQFGLFGLTDGETVALNRALREFAAVPAAKRQAAAQGVRTAVANYRNVLTGDGMVKLLDDNPFGIDIAIRATLGGALDAIDRSLG